MKSGYREGKHIADQVDDTSFANQIGTESTTLVDILPEDVGQLRARDI